VPTSAPCGSCAAADVSGPGKPRKGGCSVRCVVVRESAPDQSSGCTTPEARLHRRSYTPCRPVCHPRRPPLPPPRPDRARPWRSPPSPSAGGRPPRLPRSMPPPCRAAANASPSSAAAPLGSWPVLRGAARAGRPWRDRRLRRFPVSARTQLRPDRGHHSLGHDHRSTGPARPAARHRRHHHADRRPGGARRTDRRLGGWLGVR
jgi:hypothetical protein